MLSFLVSVRVTHLGVQYTQVCCCVGYSSSHHASYYVVDLARHPLVSLLAFDSLVASSGSRGGRKIIEFVLSTYMSGFTALDTLSLLVPHCVFICALLVSFPSLALFSICVFDIELSRGKA